MSRMWDIPLKTTGRKSQRGFRPDSLSGTSAASPIIIPTSWTLCQTKWGQCLTYSEQAISVTYYHDDNVYIWIALKLQVDLRRGFQ